MDTLPPALFVPPVPAPPAAPLPMRAFLRAIRENALGMLPEAAYHEDSMVRQFLGRENVLLNAPDAIHHVLVENHANYRRSPASIRILRPITGNGLAAEHGGDVAAATADHGAGAGAAGDSVAVPARHALGARCFGYAGATDRATGGSADIRADAGAGYRRPLDVLPGDAGVRRGDAAHADGIRGASGAAASAGHAVAAVGSDVAGLAARAVQQRWMRLIETMMHQRDGAARPDDTPRDLFDLLTAARDPETGAGFSPPELRDQVATTDPRRPRNDRGDAVLGMHAAGAAREDTGLDGGRSCAAST